MIKYPRPKKVNNEKKTQIPKKGNMGLNLENDLNLTNEYYINNKIAYIYKKPTPIKVVKISNNNTKYMRITDAVFSEKSTTDYNGIYNGYYIDFDAKETSSRTSLPIRNIAPHQIKHLENVYNSSGIGFLIVNFKVYDKYFILPFKTLKKYLDNKKKSIPYKDFLKLNLEIKFNLNPRLDYLSIISKNLYKFLK